MHTKQVDTRFQDENCEYLLTGLAPCHICTRLKERLTARGKSVISSGKVVTGKVCPHGLGHKWIPGKSIFLQKLHLILGKQPAGPGAFNRVVTVVTLIHRVRFRPNLPPHEKQCVVLFSKKKISQLSQLFVCLMPQDRPCRHHPLTIWPLHCLLTVIPQKGQGF